MWALGSSSRSDYLRGRVFASLGVTSLPVSRESRRGEKTNGYLDFEATELCLYLDIYIVATWVA